jgi:hypothetical protein
VPDDQQQQQSSQQQNQQSQQGLQSQQGQAQGQQQGQQQSQQSQGQQQQQQGQQQQQQQADWRKDIAGDNGDWLKTLERFASPKAMFESYQALRSKMSSGELRDVKPFPAKGTPEEQAAWRTENGLPAKPEEYDLKFDDGLVIGEQDKPYVDNFLKIAHAANLTPAQVKEAVRFHYDNLEAQAEQRATEDASIAQKTVDALRAEWGGEYRTNMNGMHALLDTAPAGVKEKIMNSRTADGTPVMSDPDTLRFLVSLYRQINPVSTVVPAGDEASMAKSIGDELKSIREVMRTDRKKYNADEKMQKRYRELVEAEERLKKKAA